MWGDCAHLKRYRSRSGHEVRFLAISGEADYFFEAEESSTEVIARISRDWRPDLFMCWVPELCPPPLSIEACPVKTVAVISDWNLYQPQLEHNLARFDLVLSDKLATNQLKLEGASPAYFYPIYSHRSLVHHALDLERDIDILFLGNLNHSIHRDRGRVLEAAALLSNDYRVFYDGEYPPQKYAHWMNRARIVLNYCVRREMNLRCFEAPACGALLFIENTNLEAPEYLQDGVHAVYYNLENLSDRLRYYLEHEEERAGIAEAGCQRVQELAPENRLDELFDWLEEQPRGARPFDTFDATTRSLAEVLFYASSREPSQRCVSRDALQAALEAYPEERSVQLAAGCAAMEGIGGSSPEDPKAAIARSLRHFQGCAEQEPQEIVAWMNLAHAARLARGVSLETGCLKHVLEAVHCHYGGLLLGQVGDPYYADWRLALATGEACPEIVKGAAAARLSEIELEQDKPEAALEHARQSVAWYPSVAQPYRLSAVALSRLGNLEEAASSLEAGLGHSLFDFELRCDLVEVRRALGRQEAARELIHESLELFQVSPRFELAAEFFRRLLSAQT